MSARDPATPENGSGGPFLPSVSGAGGAAGVHFFPMLLHVLVWANMRLKLIQEHIANEHAPDLEESNLWYCTTLMRVVRHFRLGIELLQHGNWRESELAWLNQVSKFEIMVGSQLYEAGIMAEHPDSGLVERLEPIVTYSLKETERLLTEIQVHCGFSLPVNKIEKTIQVQI